MCPVKGCRNGQGKGKAGLCDKHHQFRFRMKHKKPNAYALLRDSAARRGLAFTISYDYFLGLLDGGAYHLAGACREGDRGAGACHGDMSTIDRVDPTRGYEPGNLRVVNHSENVAKGNRERHLDPVVRALIARKLARAEAKLGITCGEGDGEDDGEDHGEDDGDMDRPF